MPSLNQIAALLEVLRRNNTEVSYEKLENINERKYKDIYYLIFNNKRSKLIEVLNSL